MAGAPIPSWHPGRWKVGQTVRWRTVQLVCCVGHVAPPGAVHPWAVDPKETQSPSEAALFWTPSGEAEVTKLRKMLVDSRQSWGDYQRACVWFAVGGAPRDRAT